MYRRGGAINFLFTKNKMVFLLLIILKDYLIELKPKARPLLSFCPYREF